ncbi:MAG: SDR family NAD(P)-dependent oxidoreductase [Candidatus Methylacidiphilales bacterium]|nr:SDR family NAD(P)-dependent oxidoreductase [Candidatus Methylacidiphilales bacterium]
MNPVALVTGAGRGLGADLIRHLALDGYSVAIHARRSIESATDLTIELMNAGVDAFLVRGNLADELQAWGIIHEIADHFGRLDILINNSGDYEPEELGQTGRHSWDRGIDSTAAATFFTTRAALPLLRLAGQGRVVNIGDSSCDHPGARDLALSYHIGKTGVLMITKSFAVAEAEHGVTVNMVSPGYLDNSVDLPHPSLIPANRYGSHSDIYQAVRFLIQPEAGYLTGSHLVVSGGWNLR